MKHLKKFNEDLNYRNINYDDLFNHIKEFPRKLKISRPHRLYDDGLESAISNSKITDFYLSYQRKKFKKYLKSIPFPFEKLGDNAGRFDKLNEIAHIFDKYSDHPNLILVKYMCLHLTDLILFDMYFGIEPSKYTKYDLYQKIDELEIPNKDNDLECKKFAIKFTDRENPLNYIIFYSNTDGIINKVRSYRPDSI